MKFSSEVQPHNQATGETASPVRKAAPAQKKLLSQLDSEFL